MDVCGCTNLPPFQPRFPVHDALTEFSIRLRTFDHWPRSHPIQPEVLSAAGFFFIGIEDYCVCFYCSLGLKQWNATDDPRLEHLRFNPNCSHARNIPSNYVEMLNYSVPNPTLFRIPSVRNGLDQLTDHYEMPSTCVSEPCDAIEAIRYLYGCLLYTSDAADE